MKATVFIGDEESLEPITVDHDMDTGITPDPEDVDGPGQPLAELLDDIGLHIEDYDIVSEYSFHLALWALQSIHHNSRCHSSRVTANSVLKQIGETLDIETDEDGRPIRIPFPGKPDDRPGVWSKDD